MTRVSLLHNGIPRRRKMSLIFFAENEGALEGAAIYLRSITAIIWEYPSIHLAV